MSEKLFLPEIAAVESYLTESCGSQEFIYFSAPFCDWSPIQRSRCKPKGNRCHK